jgi:hypothetical protein
MKLAENRSGRSHAHGRRQSAEPICDCLRSGSCRVFRDAALVSSCPGWRFVHVNVARRKKGLYA